VSLGVYETLQSTGDWLKNKLSATGIILLYHRVADLCSDPQLLAVKPKHFAEHLEILKRKCTPLSVKDVKGAIQGRNPPRHPVAITFDDGYADNLVNAKPLLEHYDIPATVFVATAYVGSNREFWWDDLERLILRSSALPEVLELGALSGKGCKWTLGGKHGYNADADQSWNVQHPDNPTPRHALYRSLCKLLRPLSEDSRRETLDRLIVWSGADGSGRLTHLPLTREQLARLEKTGLIEIGAHTSTHALLSALPRAQQEREIQSSQTVLEEMLGHPVATFAYPFGAGGDYTAESVELVCALGFELACANFPGMVWRRSDRFELPRLLVRDWNGETFERWLSGWIGD
jgi:peptidoglycan/xylan/chitin deacetylase (PgdA/CDA1 family)